MAAEPAIEPSEELAVLIRRAERATADAYRLIGENDRWRLRVMQQFDHMFELGAEFRLLGRVENPIRKSEDVKPLDVRS
ncbi:hypothetical protein CI1B_02420 [Bradyrhizobium ivorense]|uniref:Uncharacterized protein n=1 Tax=Bradyrhizobium ivorense TaxID=2511166 RepID=A0A508SR81_9BRAD|nr:hypothetical protein [Bradyrhizobium ivorense]VIO65145.1 hypothetical protein CI1B_02420 [Bradyrhizobium ivorense]VIO71991.1 hypothetical protein CI41S_33580 [Bradyrhizobium ivorense]